MEDGFWQGYRGRLPWWLRQWSVCLQCKGRKDPLKKEMRTQSSTFFSFNLFNWRLITLQYCGGFCHTLTWISRGCTCVPHPEPSSHLPPQPIPLGHPSAPALSTLSHASNLDWQSVSHMIIYMFQCYSLRSSHPWYISLTRDLCTESLRNPTNQ